MSTATGVPPASAEEDRGQEGGSAVLLRRALIDGEFGRVALVSSFGAESAVLLHMVAALAPATPVIFLDTGKLFPQTLRYREMLARRLCLTDLRTARPDPARLAEVDPDGDLWRRTPDACCWHRKVEPLDLALTCFDAWITGRKRFQGTARAALAAVTRGPDGRTTINPLIDWTPAEIAAYFVRHDLPPHPLSGRGYHSIGCAPCTRPGGSARDGRWPGLAKTECGIHLARTMPERLPA